MASARLKGDNYLYKYTHICNAVEILGYESSKCQFCDVSRQHHTVIVNLKKQGVNMNT